MKAMIQANQRILLDHVWLIDDESSVIRMKFNVPIEF